jgi:hypothetical protein
MCISSLEPILLKSLLGHGITVFKKVDIMITTDIDITAHMVRRHFRDPETPPRRMLVAGRLGLAGMSRNLVHLFR